MKRTALLCLLLAGCAQTPSEVRLHAKPWVFASQRAPIDAAACIARNIDEIHAIWRAQMRPRGNGYEVLTGGAEIVADVLPAENGSRITAWLSANVLGAETRDELATRATKDC